jgi:hypothetical protein
LRQIAKKNVKAFDLARNVDRMAGHSLHAPVGRFWRPPPSRGHDRTDLGGLRIAGRAKGALDQGGNDDVHAFGGGDKPNAPTGTMA